jgi:hypothetical protein
MGVYGEASVILAYSQSRRYDDSESNSEQSLIVWGLFRYHEQ